MAKTVSEIKMGDKKSGKKVVAREGNAGNSLLGIFMFFTYFDIVSASLKVKKDRCDVYEAIIHYARTGKVLDFQKEKVKSVFEIILPMIKKQRKKDLKKLREGDSLAKVGNKKYLRDNKKDGCCDCKSPAENFEGVAIGGLTEGDDKVAVQSEMQEVNNKKNISKERERVKKEKEKFAKASIKNCKIEDENHLELKPPTMEEVEGFINEKGLKVVAGVFFHFYNGKGWKIGGEVFDWREKLLEWECRKAGRESFVEGDAGGVGRKISASGRVKLLNEREVVMEDIDNSEFDKLLSEMGL